MTQTRAPRFHRVETPARLWKLRWAASRKNGCPGFFRRNPAIRVWAKPRRNEPLVPAREKIAADLGLLLGLPVAPVLLTRVRVRRGRKALALSRYARARAHRPWSRVKRHGPRWLIGAVRRWMNRNRRLLAGIWVLDTWLRNPDRTDRNVMVAYDHGAARRLRAVYFYDFDLSQRWRGDARRGDRRRARAMKTPADVRARVSALAVKAWIRRVQSLPARRIRAVVRRIPAFYLTERQKRLALRTLLYRRRQLRRAFRTAFRGGRRR